MNDVSVARTLHIVAFLLELHSSTALLLIALNNLGLVYHKNEMLKEARKTFEECLSMYKSLLPAQHPDIGTSEYLVIMFDFPWMT
jgi:hypothetical protein